MRQIRDCSVCVVGGAGFLGSHLTNHLIDDRGCRVLVIDNLVAGRREFVHEKAAFAHHDITGSEEHLCHLLDLHKCRFVFNYAAYPYVPDSYERPLHVFNINAMGALKVINAAQDTGAEAILQVSSAELYGCELATDSLPGGKHIHEGFPVEPHSTYGAAKAAIDALVQVRFREAKTPVIALRQFNCLGERETHPYVVPEIISQLAHEEELLFISNAGKRQDPRSPHTYIVRLGNNSFRDFLYAGDAVKMAVELLERGQFGEVVNLGSQSGIHIYDLAKLIGKIMGFGDVLVEEEKSRKRPWEIWHLMADCQKAYAILGHEPTLTPLEESLRRTIAWYRENNSLWPWETGFGAK